MKQKIGIYGGSFNPIHNGHLFTAENILNIAGLDKVIFFPAGNAPHKHIKIDKKDRLNMTTLAIESSNFFEVSAFEIDRTDKSYTIDVIIHVKKNNPGAQIYLIIGSDSFMEIESWYKTIDLLMLCSLIVAIRPGVDKNILSRHLRYVRKKYPCSIFLIDIGALNISSTDIRNRILIDKSIEYLIPKKVCDYISEHNLYKTYSKTNIADIKKYLSGNLSSKRFLHSINVANEAVNLAMRYNENIYKAYIAGLLHDCAKEFTNTEKIRMCNDYGIKLDRVLTKQPDLTHSFLAAQIAHHQFSVNDIEILNAISYHTTGRKRMSALEKIVYMADCTESNRIFEQVEFLRELTYENINKALAHSLKLTLEKNKKAERVIHPLSTEAFQFYKSNL